jgi:hypothetical protein
MTQQIKKELKAKAKEIKSRGCPGYINLTTAPIEKLQEYILRWENWTPESEIELEPEPEEIKPANFAPIAAAQTLTELGKSLTNLAGTGDWKDWQMSLWTKNGECRVYMKDCSYRNPKDRGYYLIKEDGEVEIFSHPNCKFPDLPSLPAVANDLTANPKISSEEKAIRNLNAQFGADDWDQRDLEDELEREEYQ